jgi:hypothetical protein
LSNRVTLDALERMETGELAAIPADELAMLSDDLDMLKADLRSKSAAFTDALAAKYGALAAAKRKAAGADTGTVTVADGEYRIKADIPARATWGQAEMAKAVAVIAGWGEAITDYVDVEYSIPEARYKNWPPLVRKEFEPARTVKPGTPTFKIIAKGEK